MDDMSDPEVSGMTMHEPAGRVREDGFEGTVGISRRDVIPEVMILHAV
jgi:hypothetical protein